MTDSIALAPTKPQPGVLPGLPLSQQSATASDGRATAITVITPIHPGATPLVRLVLFVAKHVPYLNRALGQLSFIHFARWAVVSGTAFNGAPQRKEKLLYDYLFFETNFNGSWDEYIDAFSEVIPTRMKAIWGTSFGFPGPHPVGPFKAYIHANDLPIAHYYTAYPEASTKMVLSALSVRDRLQKFASTATQHSSPAQFRAAYEAFIADVQLDL